MTNTLSRGAAAVAQAVAAGMSAEEIARSSDSLRDALDDAAETAGAFADEMTSAADADVTDEDVERELAAMERAGAVPAGSVGIPGADPVATHEIPAAAAEAEVPWPVVLPPVPSLAEVPQVATTTPGADAAPHSWSLADAQHALPPAPRAVSEREPLPA